MLTSSAATSSAGGPSERGGDGTLYDPLKGGYAMRRCESFGRGTRSRAGRIVAAAAMTVVAVAGRGQEQDFSKVEVKATRIAGNVYELEGAGGNIGVSAGSDGILIVDDEFAPLAEKIRAA